MDGTIGRRTLLGGVLGLGVLASTTAPVEAAVDSLGIDKRTYAYARRDGYAIDVSKKRHLARLVYYSTRTRRYYVWYKSAARFGDDRGPSYVTRLGAFRIDRRRIGDANSRADTNSASMPFKLYFYRGQALHYSADFARNGYGGAGASHGCVNLNNWGAAAEFARIARLLASRGIAMVVVIHN